LELPPNEWKKEIHVEEAELAAVVTVFDMHNEARAMHLQDLYCGGGPLVVDRWEDRSSSRDDDDPATTSRHTLPQVKMTLPSSPKKSVLRPTSPLSHQQQYEFQPHCNLLPQCYGYDSCIIPGLTPLLDSEESSFSSSCGTEEFFDLEEISNAFQLMERWKRQNKVRFGKAKVREYALTVGDHPVCKDGLALSLDWHYSTERVYNIDDYERNQRRRASSGYQGRRTSRLDYWQRREILQKVGSFSNNELSKIERQRHEQAVSEFLASADPDRWDPSEKEDDREEQLQCVELLDIDHPQDDLIAGLSYYDPKLEWHMKVVVIDD
jgi:hypothetical protein